MRYRGGLPRDSSCVPQERRAPEGVPQCRSLAVPVSLRSLLPPAVPCLEGSAEPSILRKTGMGLSWRPLARPFRGSHMFSGPVVPSYLGSLPRVLAFRMHIGPSSRPDRKVFVRCQRAAGEGAPARPERAAVVWVRISTSVRPAQGLGHDPDFWRRGVPRIAVSRPLGSGGTGGRVFMGWVRVGWVGRSTCRTSGMVLVLGPWTRPKADGGHAGVGRAITRAPTSWRMPSVGSGAGPAS